jgi:hypothetical protein
MREYTRRPEENPFPFHVWLAQNWISHRDHVAADICKKIAHSTRKLLNEIKLLTKLLTMSKFIVSNLLTVKDCSSQKSNLLRARICSQQKFTHIICSQHRKTAHDEKPCWLGRINTSMAKCLASSQS